MLAVVKFMFWDFGVCNESVTTYVVVYFVFPQKYWGLNLDLIKPVENQTKGELV